MQNIFEILNTLPNEVIPYNHTENGVKRKVTNDKLHLNFLIIKKLGVTLSLEIFLKSELTKVNLTYHPLLLKQVIRKSFLIKR